MRTEGRAAGAHTELRGAHEREVARLALGGLSNPEIGAQLFLSPRTVEWHLRKMFTTLGIRNRRELNALLPSTSFELVSP